MNFISREEAAEVQSHFGPVSDEAHEFAIDVALLSSRYIFVSREAGKQRGYCTHCSSSFDTNNLKHNEYTQCPQCQSKCKVKQAGVGRKHLIDDAFFVHFEKSLINPLAITAIGYYVQRDYSQQYKNVKTSFERLALYIFEVGNPRMYHRSIYIDETGFRASKKIYSLHATTAMGHKDGFLCFESVESAVKDTPYQNSTWEHYDNSLLIKFFGLFSKYPGVELLTKIGMMTAVNDRLNGVPTHRTIHWGGKNLTSILRLNKQDWKCIPECKGRFTSFKLSVLQKVRKEGSKLTLHEVNDAVEKLNLASYTDAFDLLRKHTSILKIFNYAQKQYRISKHGSYYSEGSVLSTWNDYLKECRENGLDITSNSILFPKDLHASHQRNIERKKAIADEALNEKIRTRAKELCDFTFQYNQFFIRPAKSSQELVHEGEKLKHCVGGYSSNYANGHTNIFFIRHIESPSEPLFTLEMKNGSVTQCYGYKNTAPEDEVAAFLEVFKSEKLKVNDDNQQLAV